MSVEQRKSSLHFQYISCIFTEFSCTYLGGRIEFRISSVCCAALASTGDSFCLLGGLGTGPVVVGGVGLVFSAFAWKGQP